MRAVVDSALTNVPEGAGSSVRISAVEDATTATVSAPPARATVLILDFGSQYSQLIARRVREANVYCELVPGTTPWSELSPRHPSALILSGGPASVYEAGAPQVDPDALKAGIPVLGIC